MLLKSLLIKDFRQFKGEQPRIYFSTDEERNVTIIMGDNGSGKTTLAQVFTWCLYGETTFEDKILLCKATAQKMLPLSTETVRAELVLVHNGTEYTVISEQKYQKDGNGNIRAVGQRSFSITYKVNGNTEYVKPNEVEFRIKEILPRELSRYFFFDGERIGNMSKEIRRGKSPEFAQAVRSLLGLSSFTAALDHLKSRGRNNVIAIYEASYDDKSDSKIAVYANQIISFTEQIEKIDDRLVDIENEIAAAQEKCDELNERIARNKDSELLAAERQKLIARRQRLIEQKASKTTTILRGFNNGAPNFFAMKMMRDALQALADAEKLDKGVPFINDKTIQHILDQRKCICGTEVVAGNAAFESLTKLLEFIPPKSIGNMIGEFVKECETRSKAASPFFEDFCDNYKYVRDFDSDYVENETEIENIEKRLVGLESVGGLQAELSRYEKAISDWSDERNSLNQRKGSLTTQRERVDTERQELANKDASNRKIEQYKAYAQYMYDTLLTQYNESESKMREELEQTVNEIFLTIYNGGFSLSLDEKYNIQINVIGHEGVSEDIETSTAQSISVIFAFIAGVIKMARKSQQAENAMLVSEPYPLVMDAPLSSFDKTRIQTVCEVLPAVAEQVIVFIKDTDGEIAETYLGNKVGQRYSFDKHNEFETSLTGGTSNDF